MRRSIVVALAVLSACRGRDDRSRAVDMSRDSLPVLVGAGDVAECQSGDPEATAAILDTVRGTIFVAGDVAYASKREPDPLRTCYAPTWGRHKARTRPTPGNHDYLKGSADAYFNYFGEQAGARPGGYYSYELGTWHVVALNTNIPIDAASPQVAWLRADLAAHAGRCTAAYMHHPRFSSGPHSDRDRVATVWNTLAEHGVSVVIAGHDHIYERFAPLDTAGHVDSEMGMRQFVVGTGGADSYDIKHVLEGSEVQSGNAHGVLKLTLLPDRYRWEFIPVQRDGFRDAGDGTCRATMAQ